MNRIDFDEKLELINKLQTYKLKLHKFSLSISIVHYKFISATTGIRNSRKRPEHIEAPLDKSIIITLTKSLITAIGVLRRKIGVARNFHKGENPAAVNCTLIWAGERVGGHSKGGPRLLFKASNDFAGNFTALL